jgi:hypothetical protein
MYHDKRPLAKEALQLLTGTQVHRVRAQYIHSFDRPVDFWFRDTNEEVLTIGSSPGQLSQPHHTDVIVGKTIPSKGLDARWNPPGTSLYYYSSGITAFSYTIAPVAEDDSVDYYLHINPTKKGGTVTISVRVSRWLAAKNCRTSESGIRTSLCKSPANCSLRIILFLCAAPFK